MTGCIHTLSQLTFGVHVRNNMLKKLIVFSLVVDGRAFHLQHHIIARHRSSSHTLPLAAMKKVPLRRGLDGEGTPSAIGWKSGRLERLTDWTVSKEANRPVITQYNPNSLWLWSRWKGTVLSLIYKSVLLSMASGLAIDFSARSISNASWRIFSVPPASDPLIQSLEGLRKLWGYQLTLGTFILTFFTSQAYAYWQRVYDCTRCIQGRINDFCMLFTLGAQRGPPTEGTTGQSNKAERLVQLCTRLLRMSHTLFWAATATASNGLDDCEKFKEDLKDCPLPVDDAHIGPLLLSRYGLEALVETGLLTEEEVAGLAKTKLPPSQYGYILLEWVGLYSLEGMRDGILRDSAGFEENLLRQLTSLRGEFFNLDDYRAGRMPAAYVQLVQVLVDSLVILAPFALYAELGSLSFILVGLLTFFFKGLLELSKCFLDPFGTEGNTDQSIRVDVLVSELNFGASRRWIQASSVLPEKKKLIMLDP